MDMLPNECIYEILLFLNPKYLQLCGQVNNNFNQLCQLDSLWRNQIDDKYNKFFKKESYYKNCKLYYQLNKLKNELGVSNQKIEELYSSFTIVLYSNNNLKVLPKEIGLLTNMGCLGLNSGQFEMLPSELDQLTNLYSVFFSDKTTIDVTNYEVTSFTQIQSQQMRIPNAFFYRPYARYL